MLTHLRNLVDNTVYVMHRNKLKNSVGRSNSSIELQNYRAKIHIKSKEIF
jgi:hypothetical protein